MQKLRTDEQFLRSTHWQLLVVLLCMVAAFFTWSENVAITRAIKVVGRLGVLLASYKIYKDILHHGAVDLLGWNNKGVLGGYMMYLLLGFASFMWSTDPGFSALQWFMTFQSFLFCYFFIKSLLLLDVWFPNHPIKFYNLLGNVVVVLISVFVLGMYINPDVFFRMTHGGEEARLGGYLMNPNELGMLCGVGIASLLFDVRRKYRLGWTIFKLLILFYAIYLTGSRSSLIGALLIVLYILKQSEQKKLKLIALTVIILVSPLAVYKVIFKDGDQSRVEEVMSMTGRLPFWTALINEGIPREPLLGFGFMRIDYKDFFQSTHTYPGKMTHNTFLQVLMNLGFIGLTLVLFQVFFTLRAVLKEKNELKWMLIGLFIPLLINSFTEFGIFGESNYGILFYQLILFQVSFSPKFRLRQKDRLHLEKSRPWIDWKSSNHFPSAGK